MQQAWLCCVHRVRQREGARGATQPLRRMCTFPSGRTWAKIDQSAAQPCLVAGCLSAGEQHKGEVETHAVLRGLPVPRRTSFCLPMSLCKGGAGSPCKALTVSKGSKGVSLSSNATVAHPLNPCINVSPSWRELEAKCIYIYACCAPCLPQLRCHCDLFRLTLIIRQRGEMSSSNPLKDADIDRLVLQYLRKRK